MTDLIKRWWFKPSPWHAWYQPQSGFVGGFMAGLLLLLIAWVAYD